MLTVKMVVTVSLASQVRMDRMPKKANDQPKKIGASTARPDQLDHAVSQDRKDHEVCQATTDQMDSPVNQAHLDHKDQRDQMDREEILAQLENQENQVSKSRYPDHQDRRDHQDHKDHLANRVQPAATVNPDDRDHVDLQARTAKTVHPVRTDQMETREKLAQKDQKEAATTAHRPGPLRAIRLEAFKERSDSELELSKPDNFLPSFVSATFCQCFPLLILIAIFEK